MNNQHETFSGTCQQLLFSPKGKIDGVLLKVSGTVVQLVIDAAR